MCYQSAIYAPTFVHSLLWRPCEPCYLPVEKQSLSRPASRQPQPGGWARILLSVPIAFPYYYDSRRKSPRPADALLSPNKISHFACLDRVWVVSTGSEWDRGRYSSPRRRPGREEKIC